MTRCMLIAKASKKGRLCHDLETPRLQSGKTEGLSKKLIVSHYQNNYGGAFVRLTD
jgi:hypothetical protein